MSTTTKIIEKLANKMLEEKLDFLPLEDSYLLAQADINIDTQFHWVVMSEELEDNGLNQSFSEILEEVKEMYGDDTDMLRIGRKDEFDEFTLVLCPAPTYIDLIK